jgi:hypothetical protein
MVLQLQQRNPQTLASMKSSGPMMTCTKVQRRPMETMEDLLTLMAVAVAVGLIVLFLLDLMLR